MEESPSCFREVIPDQTILEPWKEISLNTGGTQGTLQDIKVAERANGFSYFDSSKPHTRNRFIYWRISNDILELVEYSLDINLSGNRIRYKFVDTPILDGVSIHETYDNLIVLVPTVCSIHRLIFPHPDKYHRQDDALKMHPDLAAPSIFSEADGSLAKDPTSVHYFTNPVSLLPCLAASSLILEKEVAIFALGYPSGEILLLRQTRDGNVQMQELKTGSIVPKFLHGIADKLRHKDKDSDLIVSLLVHTFETDTYILSLCRDGRLKCWNCTKGECVAVIDVVEETEQPSLDPTQGAQNYIMRKAVDDTDGSDCVLGVFAGFAQASLFYIFLATVEGNHIRLIPKYTLHSHQNDLIDFSMDRTRIWSVWRGKDGQCEVYSALLNGALQWQKIILEEIPDANQPQNSETDGDPRYIYLQHIFYPGRFPLQIINKALNIHKKSSSSGDLNLSSANLRHQVCMAVEEEIQNELKETVVSDEDYLECANYCWQRFYSSCVQYHVAGLKPLGILILPNCPGAVLLRKSMFSFLRIMDVFETLTYENDPVFIEVYREFFLQDVDLSVDVMCLFEILNYLEQQLSDIFFYAFEKELSSLKSPEHIMSLLLEKIQREMDNEFSDRIAEMVQHCPHLSEAIQEILKLLHVANFISTEKSQVSTNHIFTSHLGVSLITGCLKQQAENRFALCRNLLLLYMILMKRRELDYDVMEQLRRKCFPNIVTLTQVYYAMMWMSTLPALSSLPSDTTLQRLSSFKLNPIFNLRPTALNSLSLLELFVGSTGGFEARKLFGNLEIDEGHWINWRFSFLPYLNCLFYVLWPTVGESTFQEWLLSCGQHVYLQQYVRYLKSWCDWNVYTNTFLLGCALLTSGEHYKALDLFQAAAKGVFSDRFIMQRIQAQKDESSTYVSYFLKVIHVFELHKALGCAITLANTALSVTESGNPLTATLYSVKFRLNLALKNYDQAFEALKANPDEERRNDSLRDFAKKLLDEKKFELLLGFTYGPAMNNQLYEILHARARASELTNHIYYDVLYSYLILKDPNFNMAATVKYEQAVRLSQLNDVDALQRQVHCLVMASTCLNLGGPDNNVIRLPIEPKEVKDWVVPDDKDFKEAPRWETSMQTFDTITMEMIKKELYFCKAKLRLLKANPQSAANITTPNELLVLLTSACMFKSALEIAQLFSLSQQVPFEALTQKCVNISRDHSPSAFMWLTANDLQDLLVTNTVSAAWNLLRELIEKYEEDKLSTIHKIVAKEIIKLNAFLPEWLLASYKLRNPGELFRLLYSANRLKEAVAIATEYMMAAMGHGKEYYGFEHALSIAHPHQCLPVPAFMRLVRHIDIINDKKPAKPLLREGEHLKGVLNTYLTTHQRISNELYGKHA